jgi:hypothetical protein
MEAWCPILAFPDFTADFHFEGYFEPLGRITDLRRKSLEINDFYWLSIKKWGHEA